MTAIAALVLVVVGMSTCLAVTVRGESPDRLVGLEVLAVVSTGVLLLLADAFGRSPYLIDTAACTTEVLHPGQHVAAATGSPGAVWTSTAVGFGPLSAALAVAIS
ncbi:MAG: hypothetical protein M3211_13320 [Actinomycetota bacterium]|nr:hypothetical protein [Actinomycetota bacterium]